MRSKLFVPGSRPELFDKALRGEADALSFDLEDSVSPSRKADARHALQGLLSGPAARASGKTLIARVNPRDSEHFEADVCAVVRPGLALLNLPKVETTEDVLAAAEALEAACASRTSWPRRIGAWPGYNSASATCSSRCRSPATNRRRCTP